MATLDLELTASNRDALKFAADVATLDTSIADTQQRLQTATDPQVITDLEATLSRLAGQRTQAMAEQVRSEALEAQVTRWIAVLRAQRPGLPALAQATSEMLTVIGEHTKRANAAQDIWRQSEDDVWMSSVRLSDLQRRLDELAAQTPNLEKFKAVLDAATAAREGYEESLVT